MSTSSPTESFIRRRFWAPRYDRWLRRRLPAANKIVLVQRRLFIFPTRRGLFFVLTLLVMLLTAINYQNNLVYGVTFWLAMVFVVTVHFTHGNLLGLALQAGPAKPVFPGQRAEFLVRLIGAKRDGHRSVRVSWESSEALTDIGQQSVDISLFQTVTKRGWFAPGRIKVESTYPLGLLRCWSYLDLELRVLVWPKPLPCRVPPPAASAHSAHSGGSFAGHDDLAGFRAYQRGDPLRSVDWRAYARGQGLLTRQYRSPETEQSWLDWSSLEGDRERRLSYLCYLVLEYAAKGDDYGLRLPGYQLDIDGGDRQRDLALQALALYGADEDEVGMG